MKESEPLSEWVVAISISESEEMGQLGLAEEHLNDAMAEIARYLLASGSRLAYGGDLRSDGFTKLLFELVARHRRESYLIDERPGVSNFLAWPVHVSLPFHVLEQLSESLKGAADLVCLTEQGEVMEAEARKRLAPRPALKREWGPGLSAMRKTMTEMSNARVVLGGRVDRFKGVMPGIAEEALGALDAKQALFVLGGFGGCAGDIADSLGLLSSRLLVSREWTGRDRFERFGIEDLHNGLTPEENVQLATTVHVDQAIALILRGCFRINEESAGDAAL
jgi:hypothetical protein